MSPLCRNSYNLHNTLLIIKGLIETLHPPFKLNLEGGLGRIPTTQSASQPARAGREVVSVVVRWGGEGRSRGGGY